MRGVVCGEEMLRSSAKQRSVMELGERKSCAAVSEQLDNEQRMSISMQVRQKGD